MRDVARLAGVSVATVSAVVNSAGTVSERRTARVREAMDALDYHPDQVARSLKKGRTDVIGMVIPDITNAFNTELVRGVEEAAHAEGYSVILCDSNEDPERERRQLNDLFARRVDGVMIACAGASTAYDSLVRRRFPIVFLDRIPQGLKCSGVSTDHVDSGYVATRQLIELGHERIGFIAGDLALSSHAGRLEGFRKAMQESNLPVREDLLRRGDMQPEGGYKCGADLLKLPAPPTAVISSNNKMLLGLMGAIADLRTPCPRQVSVIGFDDFVWTAHFTPRLSVVAQQSNEIGRRGMEMLLRKMRMTPAERAADPEEIVYLKAELRLRESTAPAAPIPTALGNLAKEGSLEPRA